MFLHDRVFQHYYSNLHCPNIFFRDYILDRTGCQETVGPSIALDGVPYINIGNMVKECHQWPDRQKIQREGRSILRYEYLYL